ncbi:MAG: hypothetical protein ACLR17_03100 [Enterobacteriaceae bacterium]
MPCRGLCGPRQAEPGNRTLRGKQRHASQVYLSKPGACLGFLYCRLSTAVLITQIGIIQFSQYLPATTDCPTSVSRFTIRPSVRKPIIVSSWGNISPVISVCPP